MKKNLVKSLCAKKSLKVKNCRVMTKDVFSIKNLSSQNLVESLRAKKSLKNRRDCFEAGLNVNSFFTCDQDKTSSRLLANLNED